jgi:hypothetical protein
LTFGRKARRKMNINRKHKDRLFRSLFGDESRKKNTLALYNALTGNNYTDESELTIVTLSDVIYMGMKNDVSCIVSSDLAMFEQQSTFNPNMPIRGFMYAGKQFSKYIDEKELNIYSSKQVMLPSPHYYVFYNGDKDYDDRIELKLSDAFEDKSCAGAYEWTAVMLNINYGHNMELLEKCKPLMEYSIFISKIKKYRESESSLELAVEMAVSECIRENVLADYLKSHRAEVLDMLLTVYDEEKVLELMARDHEEIGEERGIQIGEERGVEKMGKLMQKLYADGRIKDAEMAVKDADVRKQLLEELKIC